MFVHNFREMVIWKNSIDMVKNIYAICAEFPVHEKYGLISQLQKKLDISEKIAASPLQRSCNILKR